MFLVNCEEIYTMYYWINIKMCGGGGGVDIPDQFKQEYMYIAY